MSDDVSDRPELTVEVLVDHWRRQGRKLTEAGVPLERVVAALREATLQAENEWFQGVIDEAKERLRATGPHSTVHEESAGEERLVRPAQHQQDHDADDRQERDQGESAPRVPDVG